MSERKTFKYVITSNKAKEYYKHQSMMGDIFDLLPEKHKSWFKCVNPSLNHEELVPPQLRGNWNTIGDRNRRIVVPEEAFTATRRPPQRVMLLTPDRQRRLNDQYVRTGASHLRLETRDILACLREYNIINSLNPVVAIDNSQYVDKFYGVLGGDVMISLAGRWYNLRQVDDVLAIGMNHMPDPVPVALDNITPIDFEEDEEYEGPFGPEEEQERF